MPSDCLREKSNCIADMAAGWIQPPDFCPVCTQRFIAAVDNAFGPLVWHRNFVARAEAEGAGVAG